MVDEAQKALEEAEALRKVLSFYYFLILGIIHEVLGVVVKIPMLLIDVYLLIVKY